MVSRGPPIQNWSVTGASCLDMLWMVLVAETPLCFQDAMVSFATAGVHLPSGSFKRKQTFKQIILRSMMSHGRIASPRTLCRACDEIRRRDRYVISGIVNTGAYRGSWARFEAAHVFLLGGKRTCELSNILATGLQTWTVLPEF